MLELGECNQLLVTDPFTDDGVAVLSRSNHDTLTFAPSSDHHPLHIRSISPERCSSIPSDTNVDSQNGTRPRLTCMLNPNGSSTEEVSEEVASALQDDSDIIIHSVGSNDSFAGVALRYGVSIAALRRANQLWPSDPIHLRTELSIPRRGILPPRHRSPGHPSRGASLVPTVKPNPGLSPDLVASSFAAARTMILSVLPARLSLESLSSKASASEDHELDDLRAQPASDPPFAVEGHELSALTTPRTQYKRLRPVLPSLPQILPSPTNHQLADIHHRLPINDMGSRSVSSSRTVSLERLPRMQPFVVRPVRTSQLEPEPAMELPVRISGFNNHDLQADSTRRKQLPFNRPRNLRRG